jgi:hypothetical protein
MNRTAERQSPTFREKASAVVSEQAFNMAKTNGRIIAPKREGNHEARAQESDQTYRF